MSKRILPQPMAPRAWLVLILLLVSNAVLAQTLRPLFNYQGRLTDSQGDALDGFVTLEFAILERVSTGSGDSIGSGLSPIWESVHGNVVVDDGYFSVNLGELIPLPTDLLARGPLQLSVAVDGRAEFDTRFELTWSPYAIGSLDAAMLDGRPPEDFDQGAHVTDFANPHRVSIDQIHGAVPEVVIIDALNGKADRDHLHDERYYSRAEVDALLADLDEQLQQLAGKLDNFVVADDFDPTFGGAIRRDKDDLVIEGVNVVIANGSGVTESANGLGNLILGYNGRQRPVDDEPMDASGSHNLIIGDYHSYPSFSGVAVGSTNRIGAPFSVATGNQNWATGWASAVLGGGYSFAGGTYATVVGGVENRALGEGAIVLGGRDNRANGQRSIIVGGTRNTIISDRAVISGRSHQGSRGMEDEPLYS